MWTVSASAHAITTNGDVNSRGEAVMGRGCALEAKNRFPGLSRYLAQMLTGLGDVNRVYDLGRWPRDEHDGPILSLRDAGDDRDVGWVKRSTHHLISFPVKHHWHERADIELIERSAGELMKLVDQLHLRKVVIPRPGCGNGRLQWKNVRPVIEPYFDDRFVVVSR